MGLLVAPFILTLTSETPEFYGFSSLCPLNWFCWTSVRDRLQKMSWSSIDLDPRTLWKADLWGQTRCNGRGKYPLRGSDEAPLKTLRGYVENTQRLRARWLLPSCPFLWDTRKKCSWEGNCCSSSGVWWFKPAGQAGTLYSIYIYINMTGPHHDAVDIATSGCQTDYNLIAYLLWTIQNQQS